MNRVKTKVVAMIEVLILSGQAFFRRNAPLLAAGLSFYALFSIGPLGILSLEVARFFYDDGPAQDLILQHLAKYVGNDMAEVVQKVLESSSSSGDSTILTWLVLLAVLYGSHSIFFQIRRALNVILDVDMSGASDLRSALWQVVVARLMSFLTMAAVGLFLALFSLFTAIMRILMVKLSSYTDLLRLALLTSMIDWFLSFVLFSVLVSIVYRVLPGKDLSWSEVLPGSMLVAFSLFVLKYLVVIYLSTTSVASTFGAAAGVVAMMVWIYASAAMLLFGAEVNQQLAIRRAATKPCVEDLSSSTSLESR